MPKLIEHIDAIARREQRDALYIVFFEEQRGTLVECDWRNNETRKSIIEWLDVTGFKWAECGEIANENIMRGYRGSIYIDTRFDKADPLYQKRETYLEHRDGSMRFPKMLFRAIALEVAMKNAHHDELDFWERWTESF
jgi:hypothetical protein